MTTAAAIDRVVHHSLVIEFGREMKSVRAEEAARRNGIQFGGSSAAQDAESCLLRTSVLNCRRCSFLTIA
ncbi:MAG: hypothetical protein IMY86_01725 [Chloroflexi bacterium]|nr:hypothetical protein [Chloroflexota bacterium]